jgi:hypothetical protein
MTATQSRVGFNELLDRPPAAGRNARSLGTPPSGGANARRHPPGHIYATSKLTMRAALMRVGCMPLLDAGAPSANYDYLTGFYVFKALKQYGQKRLQHRVRAATSLQHDDG